MHALRSVSGLSCTIRELDRYLWLWGMYRAWKATDDRDRPGLKGEVRRLFESGQYEVKYALAELVGEVSPL